jgi:hypothetical protein
MGLLPPKKKQTSRLFKSSHCIGVVLSLAPDAPDDIHMIHNAAEISPN